MELEISKIKICKNPRSDFGNMDELVSSIREKGILEPLLVDQDNNLISGNRRLKAAKSIGLEKVPVVVINANKEGVSEIKLVENMQRKDLNPIEEAKAFKEYLDSTKHEDDYLAKKLGKTKGYIKRRLSLIDLSEDSKNALIKGKITLGHAVVLARLSVKRQKEAVKDIVSYSTPAMDISDVLNHEVTVNLDKAPFCKKDCKYCKYNGGEQTFLVDLEDDNLKTDCFNPSCFNKKVNEWIKEETEKLKDKGIAVMTLEEVKKISDATKIHDYYDSEYKKALKNLEKKPDVYVVVLNKEYSGVEKEIWRIKKEKVKSQKTDVSAEETLNLNKKENLQRKINDYKRSFLISETQGLLKPGNNLLALALREAIDSNSVNEFKDSALEKIGLDEHKKGYMSEILNLSYGKIQKGFMEISKIAVSQITDLNDLEVTAKNFGFDWKKHFVLTEEFLRLFTKDQLIDLAKELKIDVSGLVKNDDIRDIIVHLWASGQVPKILK